MNRLERIKQLADDYDGAVNHKEVWERLNKLIADHGVEAVSVASGLKITSVVQYQREAYIGKISAQAVTKAETVLSQL